MKEQTFKGKEIKDIIEIGTVDLQKRGDREDPPPILGMSSPYQLMIYLKDGESETFHYWDKEERDYDLKKVLNMVKRFRKKQPVI